jgi:hypothetical protein
MEQEPQQNPQPAFRVISVLLYRGDSPNPKDRSDLVPVFQKNSTPRRELIAFLEWYVKEHALLGFDRPERFSENLEVGFVEADGCEYSVQIKFLAFTSLFRHYPDDDPEELWLANLLDRQQRLLTWRGDRDRQPRTGQGGVGGAAEG